MQLAIPPAASLARQLPDPLPKGPGRGTAGSVLYRLAGHAKVPAGFPLRDRGGVPGFDDGKTPLLTSHQFFPSMS